MARRLGDRDVLGLALGARMQSLWGSAPQRERLATSIELEEIAVDSGDQQRLRQANLWHIRELLATGAIDAVHRIKARHEERSRGPADPLDRSYEHNLNSLLALLAGDLGTAEQLAERGLKALDHFEAMANGMYGSLLWWAWWQQGELASPDHPFRQVLARATLSHQSECAVMALVHGEAGETALALDRLGALDDEGWPDPEADLIEGIMPAVVTAACSVVGGPSGLVERLYRCLTPFAGSNMVVRAPGVGFAGPADQYLGHLARLSDDLALAEVHFRASRRLAQRMHAAPFAAAAAVELARTLRLRRPEEAAAEIAVLLRDGRGVGAVDGVAPTGPPGRRSGLSQSGLRRTGCKDLLRCRLRTTTTMTGPLAAFVFVDTPPGTTVSQLNDDQRSGSSVWNVWALTERRGEHLQCRR